MRIAFAGFRHGHVQDLYDLAEGRDGVEIVAASEPHPSTREELEKAGKVRLTHNDYTDMLADADCDTVAVGDYYGRRGEVILAALRAGKHAISDKPICTRSSERDEIAALAAEKGLRVGCQLNMRDSSVLRTMRRLIGEGAIGEVHTVTFTGQHPLLYGTRPGWYFEEGKQGGTINDIAIHAIDAVPWVTGRRFVEVVAARVWNARLGEVPSFQDGAQMMLRLDNDGGALGDVSYLSPDHGGYATPQYWRITCHGTDGVLESISTQGKVYLGGKAGDAHQWPALDEPAPGGYFESFLRDIAGRSQPEDLTTEDVLEAARVVLAIQEAADHKQTNVAL